MSLSTATRLKPKYRKKFPSLHKQIQGVFQLQKGHRHYLTTQHVYIATRPTYLGIQLSCAKSNKKVLLAKSNKNDRNQQIDNNNNLITL